MKGAFAAPKAGGLLAPLAYAGNPGLLCAPSACKLGNVGDGVCQYGIEGFAVGDADVGSLEGCAVGRVVG